MLYYDGDRLALLVCKEVHKDNTCHPDMQTMVLLHREGTTLSINDTVLSTVTALAADACVDPESLVIPTLGEREQIERGVEREREGEGGRMRERGRKRERGEGEKRVRERGRERERERREREREGERERKEREREGGRERGRERKE